jgi:pantothenate kinase type III
MEEIFGSVDIFDSARANQYAAARKIPARSIYVISTNRDGERAVMYAFSDIRHRMFRVESKDFFSKADGCYDTFGVDRAACLYGGFRITSEALLVIDGGTAMTYTGLDAKGKIMGGGISPGIGARFRCLSDYCGRLPLYTYEHYNEQREFPAFATDTKTSMIASTLQEVSLHTQNIVKLFLKELKKRASDDDSDEKQKEPKLVSEKKKVVFVTGGDAIFLKRSLGQSDDLPMSQIEIKEMKYLPTYGIGHLIQAKSNEVGIPTPDEQLRLRLLGQRVAREFPIPDTEGDSIYRGSIVGFLPGEDNVEGDLYAVRYDDGDKEECSLDQVYGTFRILFHGNWCLLVLIFSL